MNRRKLLAPGLLILLAILAWPTILLLKVEAVELRITSDAWTSAVFPEHVPVADAAVLEIVEDALQGASLAVGPWRAGKWRAQFDYADRIPQVTGTVRGVYRTEDVEPVQVGARVSWYVGDERTATKTYVLPPADAWTPFELPIRHAPPGGSTAMSVSFGMVHPGGGRALFSQLSVSPEVDPLTFPGTESAILRAPPPAAYPPSDRYRLQQSGGTWWLVRPDGRPVYSRGTPTPWFSDTETGGSYLSGLQGFGFNSVAAWSSPTAWRTLNDALITEGDEPVPFFFSLQPGKMDADFDRLVDAQGNGPTEEHGFADPFDPRFETAYREQVRSRLEHLGDSPWFVGWFADNEASFDGLYRRVYTTHCQAALKAFLETRYSSISELNIAWSTNYTSFQDLIDSKPDPELRQGAMYDDFVSFNLVVVQRFVDITLKVLREEDPGRLVFSNRFNLGGVGDWLEADVLDLYRAYDGIGVNIYPDNNSAGLPAYARQVLDAVYQHTGKPIVIGEWSVPALDSELYENENKLDWSWPAAVATQAERSRQAAAVTLDYYNIPYLVGAHWFIWADIDSETREANRGLFRADKTTPWSDLQEALSDVHARIDLAELRDPEPICADFDGDGRVGFSDFLLFAGKFGKREGQEGFDPAFDLDDDGRVGFSDFLTFAKAFGS